MRSVDVAIICIVVYILIIFILSPSSFHHRQLYLLIPLAACHCRRPPRYRLLLPLVVFFSTSFLFISIFIFALVSSRPQSTVRAPGPPLPSRTPAFRPPTATALSAGTIVLCRLVSFPRRMRILSAVGNATRQSSSPCLSRSLACRQRVRLAMPHWHHHHYPHRHLYPATACLLP